MGLGDKTQKRTDKARERLNSALASGDSGEFLLTLRDVVETRLGGIGRLAQKTGLNRESLYRTLSERGNPELTTIKTILKSLGFQLSVELKEKRPETKGRKK